MPCHVRLYVAHLLSSVPWAKLCEGLPVEHTQVPCRWHHSLC